MFESRGEAIDYLMRNGNLSVPCSPWGSTTYDCALVAYDVATIFRDANGDEITQNLLDEMMCYVVNGSDSVKTLIADHGTDEMRKEYLRVESGVTV